MNGGGEVELTREVLAAFTQLAGERPGVDPRVGQRAGADRVVKQMPGWVGRVVVLADDDQGCWLWCETAGSEDPEYSGQMVLDKPAGRYMVDVFDLDGTCLSRESAAAPPLVVGLPRVADTVLVQVRRAVTGEQQM